MTLTGVRPPVHGAPRGGAVVVIMLSGRSPLMRALRAEDHSLPTPRSRSDDVTDMALIWLSTAHGTSSLNACRLRSPLPQDSSFWRSSFIVIAHLPRRPTDEELDMSPLPGSSRPLHPAAESLRQKTAALAHHE